MRYSDRSRTELDFMCRRARYHGYDYQGKGLAPMQEGKELRFGIAIHEQLSNIKLGWKRGAARGESWNTDAFSGEDKLLAEALLIGYETVVWPRWMEHYDLVAVELECPLPLSDSLTWNSRPDTIVRRKSDQTLWYGPEDKTTSWVDSLLGYAGNVQLHATALAAEHTLGETITGCLVQGLYKGFVKDEKLFHPLVYAYCKEGIHGITPDQWQAKYKYGWDRVSTANYPGGVKAWLKKVELESVFPNSQPVMVNRELAKVYLAQVLQREEEIANFNEMWALDPDKEIRDKALMAVYPQNFSACDNFGGFKRQCQFKALCFNPTAAKFPLSSYKWREPHHPEGVE